MKNKFHVDIGLFSDHIINGTNKLWEDLNCGNMIPNPKNRHTNVNASDNS